MSLHIVLDFRTAVNEQGKNYCETNERMCCCGSLCDESFGSLEFLKHPIALKFAQLMSNMPSNMPPSTTQGIIAFATKEI